MEGLPALTSSGRLHPQCSQGPTGSSGCFDIGAREAYRSKGDECKGLLLLCWDCAEVILQGDGSGN